MDKITFTLAGIKKHSPCEEGYRKLVKSLGGVRKYGKDTPITISQIYESNGYYDALWVLRYSDEKYHSLWRHFAVDCAEQVKYLMEDERSLKALEVSRLYADGKATDDELTAARDAARDAAWAATEDATEDATKDAARDAAIWAATEDAARDAVWTAARAAVWTAARADACGATRAVQIKLLKEYCRTGKRVINAQEILNENKGD